MKDKMINLFVKCSTKIKSIIKDERGLELVTVAILAGIFALLAFAAGTLLKEPIMNVFNKIVNALKSI